MGQTQANSVSKADVYALLGRAIGTQLRLKYVIGHGDADKCLYVCILQTTCDDTPFCL